MEVYTPNSAVDSSQRSRAAYDEAIKKRALPDSPLAAIDESVLDEKASGLEQAGQKIGSQQATTAASQGNLMGTLGGAAMMTGNPYMMAAGLGVQVLAAGEQNKRAQQEKQRQEYNQRIQQRQEMMNQIAQMGIK